MNTGYFYSLEWKILLRMRAYSCSVWKSLLTRATFFNEQGGVRFKSTFLGLKRPVIGCKGPHIDEYNPILVLNGLLMCEYGLS